MLCIVNPFYLKLHLKVNAIVFKSSEVAWIQRPQGNWPSNERCYTLCVKRRVSFLDFLKTGIITYTPKNCNLCWFGDITQLGINFSLFEGGGIGIFLFWVVLALNSEFIVYALWPIILRGFRLKNKFGQKSFIRCKDFMSRVVFYSD